MQLFAVRTTNSELARKGQVLSIIIAGVMVLSALAGLINLVQQNWIFVIEQLVLIFILAGLLWLNRRGYVMLVSGVFVGFMLALPFVVFPAEYLASDAVVLALPILLGSLLLWPWVGMVISLLLIVILAVLGTPFDALLLTGAALATLGLTVMLFAGSLNRASREIQQRADALQHANEELASRSEEQHRLIEEQQALVARQKQLLEAVEELSVPIIDLSAGRLMLPIVGRLSDERLKSIRSVVLKAIHQRRARRFIFDFTGQQLLDEDHWRQIAQLITSIRLLGCTPVLTGISADLALMITQYSDAVEQLEIVTNLQAELNRS